VSSPPPCLPKPCRRTRAPDAIAARPHPQVGGESGVLSAHPEVWAMHAATPKTNIDALSYRDSLDMKVSAEPCSALAAVAAHRQARNDGGDSVLHTGCQWSGSASATAQLGRRGRTDEQASRLVCRLQQREQRVVTIGGVAVPFSSWCWNTDALQSAVSSAVQRNETKRADLKWMQANAPRSARWAPMPRTRVKRRWFWSTESRARPVSPARCANSAHGTGVRVQLEAAHSIPWLLLATLDERYGLAIESITVDRAARPGVVNASITFTQPHAEPAPRSRSYGRSFSSACRAARRDHFRTAGVDRHPFLAAGGTRGRFSGSIWHGSAGKISVNARDAGALECTCIRGSARYAGVRTCAGSRWASGRCCRQPRSTRRERARRQGVDPSKICAISVSQRDARHGGHRFQRIEE